MIISNIFFLPHTLYLKIRVRQIDRNCCLESRTKVYGSPYPTRSALGYLTSLCGASGILEMGS